MCFNDPLSVVLIMTTLYQALLIALTSLPMVCKYSITWKRAFQLEHHIIMAGTCASLASVSSKLALEEGGRTLRYVVPCSRLSELQCTNILLVLRCTCVILMLVLNGLMWNVFVKALGRSRSTVEATVVNTASNFLCTAIFGKILFGEALALLWWLGASLIVFGLIFLNYASSQYEELDIRKRE